MRRARRGPAAARERCAGPVARAVEGSQERHAVRRGALRAPPSAPDRVALLQPLDCTDGPAVSPGRGIPGERSAAERLDVAILAESKGREEKRKGANESRAFGPLACMKRKARQGEFKLDRKSTRLNSSHSQIS